VTLILNTCRYELFVHGLSGHDAQVTTLNLPSLNRYQDHVTDIRNNSVCQLISLFSYENWEDVFYESNVNVIFNNFLNTFVRTFYSCFPFKNFQYSYKQKPWLTMDIKMSCATLPNL
jgi:hypothetical protein